MLRLLYKYYGGIEWFNNKPFYLFVGCLQNCVEQERKLYDIANSIINKTDEIKVPKLNKKMRTAEEIMNDYGLR